MVATVFELKSSAMAVPRDRIDGLSGTASVRSPALAELSREPETGVLEAVARAVAHVAERRTAIPEAEIRAVALGHAPGSYTIGGIDAAIDRLAGTGDLIEVERRRMDRAFVTRWAMIGQPLLSNTVSSPRLAWTQDAASVSAPPDLSGRPSGPSAPFLRNP